MQGQNARFRLGYWKIRGLAQAVRLVFEFSATKYEEELYEQGDAPEFSREQWTRAKPVLAAQNPFMNLPYLIDKELQRPLTESKAILLHLARVLDLHGKTEQEMCNVENVIFGVDDVRAAFTRLCYSKNFELGRAAFCAELPRLLAPLEQWLVERGSNWIAAQRLTVADFFVYEVVNNLLALSPRLRDSVPRVCAHHDRVHELPSLVMYRGSNRFLTAINNKSASFQ